MTIQNMETSHSILGESIRRYLFYYTDSNFNSADHRKMVQDIEGVIEDFRPDTIFTQHPGDINTDHYWTAASCMEAFRLWQRLRGYSRPSPDGHYPGELWPGRGHRCIRWDGEHLCGFLRQRKRKLRGRRIWLRLWFRRVEPEWQPEGEHPVRCRLVHGASVTGEGRPWITPSSKFPT